MDQNMLERLLARMEAKIDSSQEKMDAVEHKMLAKMETTQHKMKASQKEVMAKMEDNKEEMMTREETTLIMANMEATIRSGQEETKTVINSIRSELEETINTRMENALVAAGQQTQVLREELDGKIMETQRHVQVVQASINTWTGSLRGDMTDIKDLQKELDSRAQGVEVRMAEVEARVELGVCGRTGSDAGWAKPPKFDGSTSWAMFRCQFQTVAEHNHWTPREKATYLIAALQGRACDVLHGVPRGSTYDETIEALEDRFGGQHLAAAYRSQLKTRTQRAGVTAGICNSH
jgi:hypothetical protein